MTEWNTWKRRAHAVLDKQSLRRGEPKYRSIVACCLLAFSLSTVPAYAASRELAIEQIDSMPNGDAIHTYTLTNSKGHSIKLMDLGATLLQVNVPDRSGNLDNVVMQLGNLSDYKANTMSAVNSVVGRYANRIAKGFTLDDVYYPLTEDANGITLHGGRDYYQQRLWRYMPMPEKHQVTFALDSASGDQGFPGELIATVTYRWSDSDALTISFAAATDKDTELNLTNHAYFNLAGFGTVPGTDQVLQLYARRYAATDALQIPTGVLPSVEGTALDFRKPTLIKSRMGAETAGDLSTVKAYDYSMPLDLAHVGTGHVAGRLYSPASGRAMEIRTTEPSIQIYSGVHLRHGIPLANGKDLFQGAGFALETQHLPDSPHHSNFPSTELKAGKVFRSTTIFRFYLQK